MSQLIACEGKNSEIYIPELECRYVVNSEVCDYIFKLESDNKKLRECVEDFILENDHAEFCLREMCFGKECCCMDRARYNKIDNLKRARQALKEIRG